MSVSVPAASARACALRSCARRASRARPAAGFTILELLVVIVVLAVIAGTLVLSLADIPERTSVSVTSSSLTAIRDGAMGSGPRSGFFTDMGRVPYGLADLLRMPTGAQTWSPSTRTGWNGPYVTSTGATYTADAARGFLAVYGADGDPTLRDGWGHPVVLQIPTWSGAGTPDPDDARHARLVSAGPDGILQTPRTDAAAAPGTARLPSRATCGDDVVLYLRVADERPQ